MNLHQFRFVQEAVRRNLNLTEAARALHTSQPGVSKAIIELEQELGVDIFTRHGKRLTRVTEPGQHALESISAILREVDNLKRIGEQYGAQDTGTFSIAATHTQARYVLPQAVARLRQRHPKITVSLHQGTPEQVGRMVADGTAEIGIATESLTDQPDLVALPCYEWQHALVMPAAHPLARKAQLSLQDIADEPLITYQPSYTGRGRIDAAFARLGVSPRVVLETIDADVIKTYVRLGMGVGIVAEMAMEAAKDADLAAHPLGALLGTNVTRVAFRRGAYLRDFAFHFAHLLSEKLERDLIERAMRGYVADYEI